MNRSMRWRIVTAALVTVWGSLAVAQAQPLLTLDEALAIARQANPTLQRTWLAAQQAENNAAPGAAGLLPQLSLSMGWNGGIANTRQQFLTNPEPVIRNGAQTRQINGGLQFRWTIFDGLGQWARYERLAAVSEQATSAAKETQTALLATVAVAYYNLVRLEQQRAVLEATVAISEERLRIAEMRYSLGAASRLEVSRAQVDLNADRAALLRHEVLLLQQRAAFNEMLGRDPKVPFRTIDTIVVDETLTLTALQEAASRQNPSLQRAQAALTVAAHTQRELSAQRWPQVELIAGYGYTNLNSESGFMRQSRTHNVNYGLSLTLNLFDGFNRRRQIENARLNYQAAQLQLQETTQALQTALTQQYAAYRRYLELVQLEQENLEAARLNVEVALEQFRLGTITSVELREVQQALLQAEERLVNARYEAKAAEIRLRELAGAF